MDASDFGLAAPQLQAGRPALINFSYKFALPFLQVAEGTIRIGEYENRNKLTTTARVDQLDDDRLVVYRRSEFSTFDRILYERIVINRQNNQIENDRIVENPNGTDSLVEKQILRPELPGKDSVTVLDSYLHDYNGS
jgi:hypothetical protein